MWLVFGSISILATCLNLYLYKIGKKYHLAKAIGLSFMALTLMANYQSIANWAVKEDWSAIGDVVPTMSKVLWILTVLVLLLNMIPLFLEFKNKNTQIKNK